MPKLFEYMGIIVFFYSNEHEPVHVHARYQGTESKATFHIEDGKIQKITIDSVAGKRPLPANKEKAFKALVEAFADIIIARWVDYFVYHKPIHCVRIEGPCKMTLPYLAIEQADYIPPLKLRLTFNTGEVREIDFAPFLQNHPNPLIRQYASPEKFQQFELMDGDLIWNDFDLCFPIADLYQNNLPHYTPSGQVA